MPNQARSSVPQELLPISSARYRILINLLSGFLNKGFNFLVMGILLPRSLDAAQYGHFMSLWRIAEGTRGFLTLGVDQVFLVEAAKRIRSGMANRLFATLLIGQFFVLVSLSIIAGGLGLEARWLHGQSALLYGAIIITEWLLAGSYLVTRFGDAKARTNTVQQIFLSIGILRAVILGGLFFWDNLTTTTYLGVTITTSLLIILACLLALLRISPDYFRIDPQEKPQLLSKLFLDTARAFAIIAFLGFINNMILSWYLTATSGPTQQAYYTLAFQLLNAISLLTGSMNGVFQREISWSLEQNDQERVFALFSKACRFSIVLAALAAHITAFNADLILNFMVGPSFSDGVPVLSILIFSGIFMGPVGLVTPMYMAFGKITHYRTRYGISLILGIIIYLLFINPRDAFLPGLGLGAVGIAIAMVINCLLDMVIKIGFFTREHPALRREINQTLLISTIGLGLIHGFTFYAAVRILDEVIWSHLLASSIFIVFCGIVFWRWPELAGFTHDDIKTIKRKLKKNA